MIPPEIVNLTRTYQPALASGEKIYRHERPFHSEKTALPHLIPSVISILPHVFPPLVFLVTPTL